MRGPSDAISTSALSSLVLLAERLQARRPRLLAGLDQHLDVEAELAARAQHRLERAEIDRVLPLVVGGAAAVDALAFLLQLPGLEPRAPLPLLPADHVAVPIQEYRRPLGVFDQLGHQE